jgi:hypothetical protein
MVVMVKCPVFRKECEKTKENLEVWTRSRFKPTHVSAEQTSDNTQETISTASLRRKQRVADLEKPRSVMGNYL